jgi:hypothetical protein
MKLTLTILSLALTVSAAAQTNWKAKYDSLYKATRWDNISEIITYKSDCHDTTVTHVDRCLATQIVGDIGILIVADRKWTETYQAGNHCEAFGLYSQWTAQGYQIIGKIDPKYHFYDLHGRELTGILTYTLIKP